MTKAKKDSFKHIVVSVTGTKSVDIKTTMAEGGPPTVQLPPAPSVVPATSPAAPEQLLAPPVQQGQDPVQLA